MYTLRACFRTFGANLYAQLVLINENSCIGAQAEVYQECVVGWVLKASFSTQLVISIVLKAFG